MTTVFSIGIMRAFLSREARASDEPLDYYVNFSFLKLPNVFDCVTFSYQTIYSIDY